MDWDATAAFAAGMFTITNPIGNAALFLGMTGGRSDAEKRKIAITCAVATAAILVAVTWVGEPLLRFFGVSIPALEATGGLIIGIIGLSMLHAKASTVHTREEERSEAAERDAIAIVPLAMPIVAGPGTITTVIVTAHRYEGWADNITISIVCIGAAVVVGGCFLVAGPMSKFLGVSGVNILTRFMGLILMAIAVGMLATGLKALMPGLAG